MDRRLLALVGTLSIPALGLAVVSCGGSSGSSAYGQATQPAPIYWVGTSDSNSTRAPHPPGGGTNQWAPGYVLLELGFQTTANEPIPVSQIGGRPFTATFRVQTADPALGSDNRGAPLQGGDLVFDLEWRFGAGTGGYDARVTQTNVARVTLDPGVFNDKTVTISGTVPASPTTPGGFAASVLSLIYVKASNSTTAQGQGAFATEFVFNP